MRSEQRNSVINHPTDDNIVVVSTQINVLFVDATTLITVKIMGSGREIRDVAISGDGTKCVVSYNVKARCVVYDITDINNITPIRVCQMYYCLRSADIHNDGRKLVCAGILGVMLFDATTSLPTKKLSEKETYFVRFIYEPEGVLHLNAYGVHLLDMSGLILRSFSGIHYGPFITVINNNRWLVTANVDNSLHIHDFATGETINRFYHHSSMGFDGRVVYQPYQKKLIGVSGGNLFVLSH